MDTERTRYGSERAGLLCGYVFTSSHPGRAIDADEAAALVRAAAADTRAAAAADCSTLIDRIKLLQDEVFRAGRRANEPHAVHADNRDGSGAADDHRLEFLRDERAGVPFQHGGGFWIVVTLTVAASALGAVLISRGRQGR